MTDRIDSIARRQALRGLGAAGVAAALPALALAAPAGSEAAAFDAAVAGEPALLPFRGIDDSDPRKSDLRCESLAVTGRWPAELRGRFYRNGPAIFERAGERYHHWFDGDGMVQQFRFADGKVSHVGRLVRTSKLGAERDAKHFLYSAFGTRIATRADDAAAPMQGPDSINVANTNAIEHAGKVLAMWEGGSAYALDPRDLSTLGPVTWKEGLEQAPFSAHPKLDPATGALWNIGTFGDKIVVWHIDAAGRLASAQMRSSPYPNGMAHDVAITAQYIVLPLPPVKMNYAAIGEGGTPEQAFRFERDQPLRVLVMKKADIAEARVFELPAQMVFHVGNAHETRDGQIVLSFVGAPDHDFLVHGATDLVAGRRSSSGGSRLQVARLDFASGRASVLAHDGAMEFPRIDPRRIGAPARFLASAANWRPQRAERGGLFHGVQLVDMQTGRVDRFDYGADAVVEEHIVVPKPGTSGERDAWLVGTVFDARRKVSVVNVIDAQRVADGPVAQASLPYWLPLGFHGNFTPA